MRVVPFPFDRIMVAFMYQSAFDWEDHSMVAGIGTVVVRRQRGKLTVQGMGQTPRGQRFIRSAAEINVKQMSDPDFKDELATAVGKLLG